MVEPDLLNQIRNPEKTALVVWDVQNALVDRIFNREEFLARTKELIGAARKHGVTVFFSKITPLPDRFQLPPRKYLWKGRNLGLTAEGLELTLKPSESDFVVPKNTASMFIGTNFELMLRNAGLTTLIFSGIATEMGVESSARESSNRGFFTIIARDAVSSMNQEAHDRSLKNLENMLIVMANSDIIAMWEH